MTSRQLIYDIILILTKFGYGNDSRLSEDYMQFKINQYRAKEIRDTYGRNGFVEPIWLQDMGLMNCTPINPADDDAAIPYCCGHMDKLTIPPIVSFGNRDGQDEGLYRVSSICGKNKFYPISFDRFNEIPEGHIRENFYHVVRLGNALYFPQIKTRDVLKQVRIALVLENPLDGFVNASEYVLPGNLVVGTSYMAYVNQVEHNGIGYAPGEIFVATYNTFTGAGFVKLATQKRPMTDLDNYPMSMTMMEVVIMKILSNEFNVEKSELADVVQDSRDQLQLVGNGGK